MMKATSYAGGRLMGYIAGKDRKQSIMFPDYLDDYVGGDNPVRFLDAFVETQDLGDLGFERAEAKDMGRPGYHPGVLLRLYLYGYLNGIRSSRKLERETHRNVELMWLIEMLTPDFKTIADFRKDNLEPIKKACRQFFQLCKQMGLFSGELVAVDGSKFKADNSRDRNFTKKKLEKLIKLADQRIEEYLTQLDAGDQQDAESEATRPTAEELRGKIEKVIKRKEQHKARQKKLEQSGETQISETDGDARLMKTREGSAVCYNVQMAVDSLNKLIVTTDVTNAVNDSQQLASIAGQAKEELGVEKLEAVADLGYYDCGEVSECEAQGIAVYMDKPPQKDNKGLFTKEDFSYNAEKDVYQCPAGEDLEYRRESMERGRQIRYYETRRCGSCQLKSKCTTGKQRRIKRLAGEEAVERMTARVRAGPDKLRLRKELVEHPFGTIKRSMGHGYFLMRGKAKVGTEMALTAMTYNLKRAINIVGVKKMLEALG
jgi:transposase